MLRFAGTTLSMPGRRELAPLGADAVGRVLPISSIRFVLAMWVVLAHFSIPILRDHKQMDILGAFRALVNAAFNGPAAVIVFFVVSGFCIHFPNRNGVVVRSWKLYYARRYLRTLIPMMAALGLALPLKVPFGLFSDSVLWSLLCEEIYYFIYPALLFLRDRIGWRYLMALCWGLSVITLLTDPHAMPYPSYGAGLNWILGLPCWLMGCRLAERLESFYAFPVSVYQIWAWRGATWMLSSLSLILRFHARIGYPWTLNLFAVFATLWIEREIRFYKAGRKPLFEKLGEATYSIYLTHFSSGAILRTLPVYAAMTSGVAWFWTMLCCGTLATAFYWLIERPSHRFARYFTRHSGFSRALPGWGGSPTYAPIPAEVVISTEGKSPS
jgi:peptidoglycan/LPS O-acetylase OafA/YrhL